MLSLARAGAGERVVGEVYKALRPYHHANAQGLYEFSNATTAAQRRSAIAKATKRRHTTAPLVALLRRNADRLDDFGSSKRR